MKEKTIWIITITLVAGGVLGYTLRAYEVPASERSDVPMHGISGAHMHEQMEAEDPVPEVELIMYKDPKKGWNAEIKLTNYRFAPENASTEYKKSEGHAHIYVDDEKINRVYGSWYYLGELPDGAEVSVRLSTNDHKELTQEGVPIESCVRIGGDDVTDCFSVEVGGNTFYVDVVDEPRSRTQGLSGRSPLASNEGMLFVFPEADTHSFWMKDMKFAIDIIWISENGEIVHIEKGIEPKTYPKSFISKQNALYVLEVLSGTVDNSKIEVGEEVFFDRSAFKGV